MGFQTSEDPLMKIVVTGSIAFDYLMSFPGQFTEHFLPDHMDRVSLSFLVDTMDKRRGGCAPNIAYTLALLGERPLLMATAGEDFGEYRAVAGVGRRGHLAGQAGVREVHRVVLLQHRSAQQPDRVVLHRRDGRRRRAVVSRGPGLRDRDHLAQRSRRDGRSTRRNAARWASAYIFDPGQQCARMSGDELRTASIGAHHRHLQRLRVRADPAEDRAGRRRDALRSEVLVVTRGENGSSVIARDGTLDVPAVATRRVVDPTGVGDAFRGGFMKGIALGLPYDGVRADRERGRDLRARASGRAEPCVLVGRVQARYEEHFGGLNVSGLKSQV